MNLITIKVVLVVSEMLLLDASLVYILEKILIFKSNPL